MKSVWWVILVAGLAGCNGLKPSVGPQQAWLNLSLKDYDYEVKRDYYSTPEYTRAMRVSVRDGKVQSAVYLDDSTAVSDRVVKSLRTIDEWHAYIEKGRAKPFFRLDVTYHEEQGYPTYLHADVRERVADDEQTVRIENLVPR